MTDLSAAVAAASAATPDPVAPATSPVATAPATAPAPTAEQAKARISAILRLDAAKGREGLAQTLALETDVSVEQAEAILNAAPVATAAPAPAAAAPVVPSIAQRAASVPGQGAVSAFEGEPTPDARVSWDKAIAKVRRRFDARQARAN